MMNNLKSQFENMLHMSWYDFCLLETDRNTTIDDSNLSSFVRLLSDSNDMSAMKLGFDRADGIQPTQVEIEVPKFYVRYPNAASQEAASGESSPSKTLAPPKNAYDPASAKLRETLQEMRRLPRTIVPFVRSCKKSIEKSVKDGTQPPEDSEKITVKTVIVANLLHQAGSGKFKAIDLIFEQIDGKLPKAIQLLGGEDVIVDDLTATIAPPGAIKGDDGVYMAEDKIMTNAWLRGLSQSRKGLEILAEGLDD